MQRTTESPGAREDLFLPVNVVMRAPPPSLEDVLACPCGGRRKIIAFINEAEAVKAILESLGLPATGPPTAPARSAPCPDEGWQDDVPTLQRC